MENKVYEVIDYIQSSDFKKKLDEIKFKIANDDKCKDIIKKFYESKILFEKYNLKEDYIYYETNLFSNELIKEYLKIQNNVNLLELKINSRLNKITKK